MSILFTGRGGAWVVAGLISTSVSRYAALSFAVNPNYVVDRASLVVDTFKIQTSFWGLGRFSGDATHKMEPSSPMGALPPPSILDIMG